ncbi:MAG: penicillin acylase family protein [Rhodobacter sp.]|jgi:penicillin G amidase|nr:penicillin acylase family protein [Rhodobacter sp.]
MQLTFRWLMRLFIGLSGFLILAAMLAYYLASQSLPDYSKDRAVKGLIAPIEIVRDVHNVPHIFADHDRDAFFGLGYAHAQDRLWQMTLLRRTAQGRLSELFGERTLELDFLLRQLDLYGAAQKSVSVQDPATTMALKAYADGVNAWLEAVRDDALGRGAPEFFIFSRQIAPWQPADSLAILKVMALQLSGHLSNEVLRSRLSLVLSNARLSDILPDAPGPGGIALPSFASLFPSLPRVDQGASQVRQAFDPVPDFDMAGASNAWAAAPSRSANQGSLLANDPHLGFTAPAIWMLARLELQSGDVIGATIPGMPLILSGRSAKLGWGITSAYLDDQDLLIEKLNPNNATEYLTPNGFKPFVTKDVTVTVNGGKAVTRTLRWTENGPVLPANRYNLEKITPEGHVVSLQWTALDPSDKSMSAAMKMMHAPTVALAIDAARDFVAPAQNLTLVDKTSIGFQMIGKMANRPALHQSQGRLPTAGWLAENLWAGYLPYENNPRIIDPLGGLVANTNNKTVDRPFPNHVSFSWGDSQRIERLRKLMGNRLVHTRASFIEAQLDQVSFSARALLPLIAKDLWFASDADLPTTSAQRRKKALALLADWNGEMNEHLPEPLIFTAWMRVLQDRLIKDEIGSITVDFTHYDPVFLERVFRNLDGASVWCDVVQSTAIETCTEIAQLALDVALENLSQIYGLRVESWRWGDAHIALQDHSTLGKIPLLGWLVNIRQSTSGGDNTLMRGRTSGSGDNPFANVHGAGYRGVYDFGDPDGSVFIISTGQSGHFLSRFYDDQAQLWRRGEYIPMSLDPALAQAAAVGISVLSPKR